MGRGFSLPEMLVALGLALVVLLGAVLGLRARTDCAPEREETAVVALDRLERELARAGEGVGAGQPRVSVAGPWTVAINADLDPEIPAVDGTGGAETIRYGTDPLADGSGRVLLVREVLGPGGTLAGAEPLTVLRGPAPRRREPTAPLFVCWGDFDADGALDLWGDTGAGGGIAHNGALEPGEVVGLGHVPPADLESIARVDVQLSL